MFCFLRMPSQKQDSQITFDYRGFGESDGERGRLVPAMQTEDIISAIGQKKQECIDNQRIGLWGTSLGGACLQCSRAGPTRKMYCQPAGFADGDVLVTGEMNESERASFCPR